MAVFELIGIMADMVGWFFIEHRVGQIIFSGFVILMMIKVLW